MVQDPTSSATVWSLQMAHVLQDPNNSWCVFHVVRHTNFARVLIFQLQTRANVSGPTSTFLDITVPLVITCVRALAALIICRYMSQRVPVYRLIYKFHESIRDVAALRSARATLAFACPKIRVQ